MFGIVQGSVFRDLREKSLEGLLKLGFDGYGIGGEEEGHELYKTVELICAKVPKDKPVYMMGIGKPKDIRECVSRGVSMFDCVRPTREARHGRLYISENKFINICNSRYRLDFSLVSKECQCPCCKHFTKSYLHHLLRTKEGLGYRLASLHNLYFLLKFIKDLN